MTVPEAKAKGAIGLFESKYGERVSTYRMGDYSFEICAGPHTGNTGDHGSFRIRGVFIEFIQFGLNAIPGQGAVLYLLHQGIDKFIVFKFILRQRSRGGKWIKRFIADLGSCGRIHPFADLLILG